MAQGMVRVLLGIGVLATVITSVGILAGRTVFDRLHYLGPAASVGTVCIAAAVAVQEGFSQAGIKAIAIAVVIVFMNPVLTHATARAARVRRFGELIPSGDNPNRRERGEA